MLEVLSYSFMQRAFIAGNIIAVIAPMLGVFLVLRRLALMGNTISHVALAGVAIGLLLGVYPVYTAIIVSVLAALAIEKFRTSYRNYSELSLSIILAAGLGLATLLISMLGNSAQIYSYLFGSITLVTSQDVYLVLGLGLVIIALVTYNYYGFFSITFNEEDASLSGLNVSLLNVTFIVLVSLAVSLAIRIIGGLLTASLITLPVATGLQVAGSFKQTMLYSILFAVLAVNLGLVTSFYFDLAPGGAIILTGVGLLLLVMTGKNLKVLG
ncbi:MAG: metal ABC transporter permease [Halanaerobium sp.]|nr:metal ABC transporter permease [Halanaerobium sp.]